KTDIKSEDKQITGMQIMFDNSFNKSMI
ncbi:MAG: hypothetical protein QG551_360, partial [Patescibacteria group bacterium]|nr:hypothetical protein [Patescibacteria group bacterium]